ncbi:outer membrane protein [Pseudorhodobacter antarcticus]|jgi:outer membrane protein|uniref:Outer membrane protein n=1 Tax=Pseudorhodobacter antarcticus TaxID=1077947 RepID=A0A1H8GA72_9RHOB|nr:TolC family outer membrane protein [Pseudorhodobacter antarcticus]SEN40892.1 outer membrane protein [Pseudorhodobacter antarcticus]
MKSFGTWLRVGVLGVALGLPHAVWAESLADALIAAYRNSNILDQNRAVLRAADEDVAIAVSSLRPVLTFRAGGGYTHTPITEGLSGTISLLAEMTLFDFGRNAATIAARKETVLATRQALIGFEQDVLLNAVSAYVTLQQRQDAVALRQSNLRLITQELRAAQDRFEVGEITRTDVAIADSRLASSQAELATAQGDLAIARETYKLAIGKAPKTLSRLPKMPRTANNLAEAQTVAKRTHPSIRQLQHEVSAAEAGIALAKANMGPTLTGNLGLTDGSKKADSFSASVTLNQTLYAGGRPSAFYRQALARRDIAQAQLQQTTAQIMQSVGVAWSSVEVAQASIAASDRQIRSAQTAYNGVSEEAKLGSRTTLDVLNAEQELLSARTARLSAQAGYYTGVYSLLARMGLLTVDHLQLGIPTYDPDAYYNAVKSAPVTSSQGKRLDRVLKAIGN